MGSRDAKRAAALSDARAREEQGPQPAARVPGGGRHEPGVWPAEHRSGTRSPSVLGAATGPLRLHSGLSGRGAGCFVLQPACRAPVWARGRSWVGGLVQRNAEQCSAVQRSSSGGTRW